MTNFRKHNGRYASPHTYGNLLLLVVIVLAGATIEWLYRPTEKYEPLVSAVYAQQVTANPADRSSELAKEGEKSPSPSPAARGEEKNLDVSSPSEYQKILHYLVDKFGDRAADAIVMIRKCENGDFNPNAVNRYNSNGTCDVGVMQINTACDSEEFNKLKNWKYNIDQGYKKFKAGDGKKLKNTFYLWSCGDWAGDKTYKQVLEGK